MQFILDYDLTLSDYHRFIVDSKPYKSEGTWVTPAIWDILDASEYLYDDVLPFLKSIERTEVRILTARSPVRGPEARAFQKAKLERSGLAEYVSDIVFMEGKKCPYIKEMYHGVPTVFVDDHAGTIENGSHRRVSRQGAGSQKHTQNNHVYYS